MALISTFRPSAAVASKPGFEAGPSVTSKRASPAASPSDPTNWTVYTRTSECTISGSSAATTSTARSALGPRLAWAVAAGCGVITRYLQQNFAATVGGPGSRRRGGHASVDETNENGGVLAAAVAIAAVAIAGLGVTAAPRATADPCGNWRTNSPKLILNFANGQTANFTLSRPNAFSPESSQRDTEYGG